MKKGQVQPLIGLMIALIVGIALAVPVVLEMTNLATESQSVTNESINCTNATTQALANEDLLSGTFALTNGTIVIGSGNYTLSTSAGTVEFILLNNSIYGSSCWGNYSYYDPAYQTSSTNRTLTALLPLLIVVAIVLLVVGWIKLK